MAILEYKLHASSGGMRCPVWVEDGGYFLNSADHTMVGWARDDAEWHTPDTVITMTVLELETRLLAMHASSPFVTHPDGEDEGREMTESEVREMAQSWAFSREY